VYCPAWVIGDANARDNKLSLFAAYERNFIARLDNDPTLRNNLPIEMPSDCEHCGARSERSVCGACLVVCFCSRECQRARFATHSIECSHFRQLYDIVRGANDDGTTTTRE